MSELLQSKSSRSRSTVDPRTRLYRVWAGMIQRCTNPNNRNYRHYGGRGITVCARWLNFSNFLADMGLHPFGNASIERQENEGNYEPGNCCWATPEQQAANRRNSWRGKCVAVRVDLPTEVNDAIEEVARALRITKREVIMRALANDPDIEQWLPAQTEVAA